MRRTNTLTIAIIFLLAASARAQAPATCIVSGTVYKIYQGQQIPAAGAVLWVEKIVKNGSLYSTIRSSVRADANGVVTITVPRSSVVYLSGEVLGLDKVGGVALAIPDAATATLESLVHVASVPTTGIVVKQDGTAKPNKEGTLNFTGAVVTETTPGSVTVAISAGNVAHASTHAAGGSDPITISESQVSNLSTDLAGKQALDSDLTAIAGLTPTNDDIIQRKAGAWVNRTVAQLSADLVAAGAGTVTSVALTVPGVIFSVSGSPITGAGTLNFSLLSQTQNRVFAAPNGSSGTPSFRALVAADIPTLPSTQISGLGSLASVTPTGTPDGTKFLRDDSVWAVPAGGSSGSLRIIYASKIAGIHLDSNLSTGGGTDDTSALQTVLNTASSTAPLKLVLDGVALVTGLRVKSYTTVETLPGCGFFLAANSNKAILTNYNRSKTTRTDTDIHIYGGTYNANGTNQSAAVEADGTIVTGIGFFGVTDSSLQGVSVSDPKNWGLVYSNAANITVEDYKMTRAGTRIQQDGINIRGPAEHVTLRNLRIKSFDDAVALNSRDYTGTAAAASVGPYVGGGAITDVLIDGVDLDDALFGVDLISDQYSVDRIVVRNVHGTCRNYALYLSYDALDSGYTGTGNFGSILAEDIDVRNVSTPYSGFNELIRVGAVIDSLAIKNLRQYRPIDYRPLVNVLADADVKELSVTGLDLYDALDVDQTYGRLEIAGKVAEASVSDVRWYRDAAARRGGTLVRVNAGAGLGVTGSLRVSGATARRITALVTQAAGALAAVHVNGSRMTDTAALAPALSVVDVTPEVTMSNVRVPLQIGGTGGGNVTNRMGDAFDPDSAQVSLGSTGGGFNTQFTADYPTYADVGLQVTLPGPGVYLVWAKVRSYVNASTAPAFQYFRFYDSTAGAAVAGSPQIANAAYVANQTVQGTTTVMATVTVASSRVVKLQISRSGTGFLYSHVDSSTSAESTMGYVRLLHRVP
jgi:hypothetical protein